ncbi:MAG: PLP-dependent aminotransferase family protein [Polaribacter sp.]|uniref:MocR-like pyridoxine biosynthesis transcription factor PdxR n=1 Tax=Polaribacter sp. TaxID=1920175 RepID=UPI002F35E2FC
MTYNIISRLISIDKKENIARKSIYKKVFENIKNAIINESIPYKTKLPSSRELAKDLNISRSTVIKAYDLLSFERFIIAKKGSGYIVCFKQKNKSVKEKIVSIKKKYPKVSKKAKLFQKYSYLSTDNFTKKNVAFRPGLPPLDMFPIKTWKNLSNAYWREATPTNLSYAPSEGLDTLRINIANYLKIYRNIDCEYSQIIIVSGSLHSLYLIGNSLIDKNDKVIMENPTFPRAYNLFKSLKADVIPCEVDKDGIRIDTISNDSKTKLIYTTPSNQYPLGIKMSKSRRLEVLEWASKNNSLIIEDDYDHEFSNWENPIPSIYSLDKEERVIYQGTFNKLLHPSLRIGYMIVPKYLIDPIKSIYEQSSRFVPVSSQSILNNFITNGHLNKHIRNVIEISKERKKLFKNQTKDVFNYSKINSGLHIIGKFKNNIDDVSSCKMLQKNNVIAYPLSNYYINKEKEYGLVMGYSSVNNKVMKEKTDLINNLFST